MMHALLTISDKEDHLKTLFEPELEALNMSRAQCSLEKKGTDLQFTITADDSVAFRATITSITKVISLYEIANKVVA